MDGVLAGYMMIKPKEGWEYTKSMMKDPNKEFLMRYAGLRATRFLHDFRPDLVTRRSWPMAWPIVESKRHRGFGR